MKQIGIGTLVGLILLPCIPAHAVTWLVPSQCPTIQAGIDSASAGDTVLVACGTYTWGSEGTGTSDGLITMKSGIVLRSETGLADCVTIGAMDAGRVMYCSRVGSATKIEGFTFTDGSGTSGGGVECSYSSLTFSQCSFEGDYALTTGGGICCRDSSSVTFAVCSFTSNSTSNSGGGICCLDYSNPTLENCTFTGNSGNSGGAMYCHTGCTATVTSCTFTGNTVLNNGAGMWAYECPPALLTTCVFSGNSAGYSGGATYFYSCSPNVVSCTFCANSSGGEGSGICLQDASLAMDNTIIASAPDGGAVFIYGSGTANVACSNVYGNTDGDWTGPIAGQEILNNNMSQDPQFCDPPEGNLGVGPDSPCLAANSPCGILIGAVGESCAAGVVARAEKINWSGVKVLYR